MKDLKSAVEDVGADPRQATIYVVVHGQSEGSSTFISAHDSYGGAISAALKVKAPYAGGWLEANSRHGRTLEPKAARVWINGPGPFVAVVPVARSKKWLSASAQRGGRK